MAHPNHNQPIDRGGGLDGIISKTTGYSPEAARREEEAAQQRRHYRGVAPTSPPTNEMLGAVVTFEKTDLWFVFSFVQMLLLLGIYLELRGG